MKVYKGFILAAGLGTRMRPMTDHLPKPLIPFLEVPIIEWIRRCLFNAEVRDLAVNIHHLPKKMDEFLDSSPEWKKTFRSYELPEILGSGGALSKISEWRKGSDLVTFNGDVVSDLNLRTILAEHEKLDKEVTLVLTPKPLDRDRKVFLKGKNVVGISHEMVSEKGISEHGYAGVTIYKDSFFKRLPKTGNFSILDFWIKAADEGQVAGVIHSGFWSAIDSPEILKEAQEEARKHASLIGVLKGKIKLKGDLFSTGIKWRAKS